MGFGFLQRRGLDPRFNRYQAAQDRFLSEEPKTVTVSEAEYQTALRYKEAETALEGKIRGMLQQGGGADGWNLILWCSVAPEFLTYIKKYVSNDMGIAILKDTIPEFYAAIESEGRDFRNAYEHVIE